MAAVGGGSGSPTHFLYLSSALVGREALEEIRKAEGFNRRWTAFKWGAQSHALMIVHLVTWIIYFVGQLFSSKKKEMPPFRRVFEYVFKSLVCAYITIFGKVPNAHVLFWEGEEEPSQLGGSLPLNPASSVPEPSRRGRRPPALNLSIVPAAPPPASQHPFLEERSGDQQQGPRRDRRLSSKSSDADIEWQSNPSSGSGSPFVEVSLEAEEEQGEWVGTPSPGAVSSASSGVKINSEQSSSCGSDPVQVVSDADLSTDSSFEDLGKDPL